MNELIIPCQNPPFGAEHVCDGSKALSLCEGRLFEHGGKRYRLDRIHRDGAVELIDLRSKDRLQVKAPKTGARVAPSVNWIQDQYTAGHLRPMGATSAEVHQANFALRDPDGAGALEVKAHWRVRLCRRALADNVAHSSRALDAWLDANFGSERCDLDFPRPTAPSLLRWMREICRGETEVSPLASQFVRLRNRVARKDATLLHAIVFDNDWRPQAAKVKVTVVMDVFSTAILGFALSAGPN